MSERHTGAIARMTWREFGCMMAVFGLFALGAIVVVVVPMMFRFRIAPQAHRVSCAYNLKQIGLSLKMYANESKGEKYPRQMYYYEREVDCDNVAYPPVGEPVAHLGFVFNLDDMYPEYLPDLAVLVCPENERSTEDDMVNPVTGEIDRFRKCAEEGQGWHAADDSFWYIGHLLDRTGSENPVATYTAFEHLAPYCADDAATHEIPRINAQYGIWMEAALRGMATDPEGFRETVDTDWDFDALGVSRVNDAARSIYGTALGNETDGSTLYRLKEGVSRFLMTDVTAGQVHLESTIPIVYDVPSPFEAYSSHEERGGHVLYLDGHVEFVKYPDAFPFHPAVAWISECIRTGRAD